MESTLAFRAYEAKANRRPAKGASSRKRKVATRKTAVSAPEVRAKVLMLHGYAMNAKVFTTKTKTLAKKLRQRGFECIYLDAPFLLPMTSIVMVDGVPVEIDNGGRPGAR